MLDDSDLYEMKVCGNCGMIATRKKVMNQDKRYHDNDAYYCTNCGEKGDIRKVKIPYAMKLLIQEIGSMSIGVKIGTEQ